MLRRHAHSPASGLACLVLHLRYARLPFASRAGSWAEAPDLSASGSVLFAEAGF